MTMVYIEEQDDWVDLSPEEQAAYKEGGWAGVTEARTGAKAAAERERLAATRQPDYQKLSTELQLGIAAGDISEADAIQRMTGFIKEAGADNPDILKNLTGTFQKDWGETVKTVKAGEQAEQIRGELESLTTQITEQLGAAEAEAMGFLEAGKEEAIGALAAGEERALADVRAGEEAAIAETERGLAAIGGLTEEARGAVETGAAAAMEEVDMGMEAARQQADVARGEVSAGREAALSEIGAAREEAAAQIDTGITEAGEATAAYRAAGERALSRYERAMAGDPAEMQAILEQLPGYQFRLSQGIKATQRMQAAQGRTLGGRALQELQQVGQGMASEEFGRYLAGEREMIGVGQAAVGQQVAATTQLRGQAAGLEAGFGEMAAGVQMQAGATMADIGMRVAGMEQRAGEFRAGITQQEAATLADIGMTQAGMVQATAAQAANIRQQASQQAAAITTDVAGRRAMIESSTAGMQANLKMGTAESLMQTAGQMGMAAAGITSDFYKMTFSADLQRDLAASQMAFQKEMAQWEAKMAKRAAQSAGEAQIFGSLIGATATVLTASDRRVKRNIRKVGTTADGINLYSYNYKWDNTLHVGVMAQEVGHIPGAVVEIGGVKHVDYSKVM